MTNQTIDKLMKELGSMNYKAPDISKSIDFNYKSPVYRPINVGDWNFTAKDFGSLASPSSGKKKGVTSPNVLDMLSGVFGQMGGAVTNEVYNVIDGFKNSKKPWYETAIKDIADLTPGGMAQDVIKSIVNKKDINHANPLYGLSQGVMAGAKNQVGDWKDVAKGNFNWGAIPGAGFLHGMDTSWKRGSDIMTQAGVKNKWGNMLGGIGLDVALDPTTYLTGGTAAALKAGKAAELSKISDLSTALGIGKKIKNAVDFKNEAHAVLSGKAALGKSVAESQRMASIAKDMKIPHPVSNMDELLAGAKSVLQKKYPNSHGAIEHKLSKIKEDVATSGKSFTDNMQKQLDSLMTQVDHARNTAYNANINTRGFSLPKVNKTVGNYTIPKWSPNFKSEATLGSEYRNVAEKLITTAAKGNAEHAVTIKNAILKKYKVTSLEDLTKTQVNELYNVVTNHLQTLDKSGNAEAITKAYLKKNKIKDIKDLTKAQKSELKNDIAKDAEKVRGGLPDAKVTEQMVTKEMPNELYNIKTKKGTPNETVTYTKANADAILKSLEPKVAKKIEPLIKGLKGNDIGKYAPDAVKMFGEFAPKLLKTVKGKTAKEVNDAFSKAADILKGAGNTAKITKEPDIIYKELQNIVEVMKHGSPELKASKDLRDINQLVSKLNKAPREMTNAPTKFEHLLNKHNPFEARSLHTGNEFLDSMGNHIADANSQKLGDAAVYAPDINKIQKYIKKNNISPEQMQHAIYVIEGQAPKSFGENWTPSAEVQGLADMIKPLVDKVGKDELANGVLSHTRDNYFPHVLNQTEADIEQIKTYKDEHGSLNGLKLENRNNRKRTSFDTLAQRDDYLSKLAKDLSKTTDIEEQTKLQKQIDEVAKMFDTDIVSALTRRVKEGVRAKAMKDMQGELQRFGMMATNPTDGYPKGLQLMDKSVAKKLGLGEGQHYIHPEVLKGLERVDEVFTNQGMQKWVRHLNATTDIFKNLVTTYKVSHYRNNALGNTFINVAAGVKISDYKKASKLISGFKYGTLTEPQMKLMKEAFKKNVMSGGFMTDNHFNMHFNDPTKLEKVAHAVGNNKVASKAKQLGEQMDDYFRLANYINGIEKYGSSEKAAEQVRTYLFNYNELTNADRKMRVAVPFWNWTKRNIPLQAKLLLDNPKFAVNLSRFQQVFNDNQNGADWQKESGVHVPQWMADTLGAKGQEYYTSMPLPTQDLNTLANLPSFLGSLAPGLKIPGELAMNKQFFTGKPISYGSNTVQMQDLPGYLAKQGGITGNFYDGATGKKNTWESIINYLNPIYKVQPNQATN